MKHLLLLLAAVVGITSAAAQTREYDYGAARRIALAGTELIVEGDYERLYYDPETGEYLSDDDICAKYGDGVIAGIKYVVRNKDRNVISRASQSALKMRSANLAAGCTLIGGALSASLLSSVVLQNRQEQNSNNLAAVNRAAKTQKIINGVCAGVGVIGVITVLTGLYREDAGGITIAPNVTLQDYNAGMALQVKF